MPKIPKDTLKRELYEDNEAELRVLREFRWKTLEYFRYGAGLVLADEAAKATKLNEMRKLDSRVLRQFKNKLTKRYRQP